MNPTPQIESVFPLSAGTPERPALRPPRLSLSPEEAAEFFAEFALRAVGRRPLPILHDERPPAVRVVMRTQA